MGISIVTISFNQFQFLPKCVESILSDSSIDVELIVVDPGSTDGSREWLSSYSEKDSRLKLLFKEDNGPAMGLNNGLEVAQKDIFGFINSDDYLMLGSLERIQNFFNSNKSVDVAMAYGYKIMNGKSKLIIIDKFSPKRYAYSRGSFLQQSIFFQKNRMNESNLKFNESNKTCWDVELLIDAYNSGLVFHRVRDAWGVFRIHNASISGSGRLEQLYNIDQSRLRLQIIGPKWNSNIFTTIIYLSGKLQAIKRMLVKPFYLMILPRSL